MERCKPTRERGTHGMKIIMLSMNLSSSTTGLQKT